MVRSVTQSKDDAQPKATKISAPWGTYRTTDGFLALLDYTEEIASLFFRTKWRANEAGTPFADNLAIVEHLVETGAIDRGS